ncbi:hypothetical protein CH293_21835 [Rhodococcus sp. 14-2470-1b]|uniref:hypothetical protein n=1 Tax=Rhodococcus sp. 14-2470-1b TaxID=2023149 RepID=UPI000B9BD5F3|nr:hypothetical protein [Rhodococcus sp. 14-2470-1b]OZF45597.1 hypothetical protein CH293_21835 [Rhodococcus sp. 14-2470-1b]
MTRMSGAAPAAASALAAVVLLFAVGIANPVPRPGVNTDTLGPDTGEAVAEYVARAEESLAVDSTDPDSAGSDSEMHWALVSFDAEVSPARAYDAARNVRIAQVLLRVPIERVQTQVITVGVPGTEASVLGSAAVAGSRLHGSTGQWDRQAQIDAVSSARLVEGCECVVGLIVRGSGGQLRTVDTGNGVRAVEALPPDAIAGRFAVRALLPDYVDVVGPLPDDGPVPAP